MAGIIDKLVALRVLYLLITPIESTDAFKYGLIDSSGKTIRKAKTSQEKSSTGAIQRLVWNLKRIISLIPGGSTRIGSAVAGYALMREAIENNWSEDQLTEECFMRFNELCESEDNSIDSLLEELNSMEEDAPANATGSAVSTDIPVKRIGQLERRKKYKSISLPGINYDIK